jgi:hypothetical protein
MKGCSGWGILICELGKIVILEHAADAVGSYVRMVGSPALYNVGADYLEGDPTLVQKRGQPFRSLVVIC